MAALKVFHFRGFHIQKWNIIIRESGTFSTFGFQAMVCMHLFVLCVCILFLTTRPTVFILIASMKNRKQKRVGRQLNLRKEEDKRSTVREVKDGQRKLRVAARSYNLTLGFLQRRVKGTVSNTGQCRGRKTVLAARDEQAMANHCLLLARRGQGRGLPLKRQQLRSLA